jgi:hypothetical protein
MASKEDILGRFRSTLLDFADELIELFPDEGDLSLGRTWLGMGANMADIIEGFWERSKPWETEIAACNSETLISDDSIFSGLEGGKILHMKTLWKSPNMTAETKEIVWAWVHALLALSRAYSKKA